MSGRITWTKSKSHINRYMNNIKKSYKQVHEQHQKVIYKTGTWTIRVILTGTWMVKGCMNTSTGTWTRSTSHIQWNLTYLDLTYPEYSFIRTHVWESIIILYIEIDYLIRIFSYLDKSASECRCPDKWGFTVNRYMNNQGSYEQVHKRSVIWTGTYAIIS